MITSVTMMSLFQQRKKHCTLALEPRPLKNKEFLFVLPLSASDIHSSDIIKKGI